jgi:hypothetical protein
MDINKDTNGRETSGSWTGWDKYTFDKNECNLVTNSEPKLYWTNLPLRLN